MQTADSPSFRGFRQRQSNYSELPHEFIDLLPSLKAATEIKVLLYLLRHTWGFQEFDRPKKITIDEFMHGRKREDGTRMDGGTGLSEQGVRDGIAKALEHNYILVEVDSSDKARIEKSYMLNMLTFSEVKSLDPQTLEVKSLDLYPPNFRPRSEKETIETNNSRGDAPHGVDGSDKPAAKPAKTRKPDPLFDAVAKQVFGISDSAGLSSAGSTVGAIKGVVKRLCAARAPEWGVEEQCAAVEGYVKQCTKQNPVQKWKAGFEPAFLKYLETKLAQPPKTVTPSTAVAGEMQQRADSFNIQRAIAAVRMFHASDKPSHRELLATNTRFLTERGYTVKDGEVIAPEPAIQTA